MMTPILWNPVIPTVQEVLRIPGAMIIVSQCLPHRWAVLAIGSDAASLVRHPGQRSVLLGGR